MDNTRATGTKSVTKRLRIAAAVVIPSLALVGASLAVDGGAATAAKSHDNANAPKITAKSAAKRAPAARCDGGYQKKVWNRGAHDWQWAESSSGPLLLQGTHFRFKGPDRGRDVLSANLSAMAYLYSGSYGKVKVLVDGFPMRPSDPSNGSYYYDAGTYGTFAQNYCKVIGPGWHDFQITIEDKQASSGYYFGLNDAMVHVEQNE
jgi:hypothetical protein